MKIKQVFIPLFLTSSLLVTSAHAKQGDTAINEFKWSGSVPQASISNGISIQSLSGDDFQTGSLRFDKTGKLTSSTSLTFKVSQIDEFSGDLTDFTPEDFAKEKLKYTVFNFQSSGTKSGSNQTLDDNQYFALLAYGLPIARNVEYEMNHNTVTLNIGTNLVVSDKSNTPVAGDVIEITAGISVSSNMI
jgi:hypothetical protein